MNICVSKALARASARIRASQQFATDAPSFSLLKLNYQHLCVYSSGARVAAACHCCSLIFLTEAPLSTFVSLQLWRARRNNLSVLFLGVPY